MDGIRIPKNLDYKYASLWHDANSHKLPAILKPMGWLKPLNERDLRIHTTAIYQVMNMLAEDGLIKQETIREIHNKENGWVNRSRIKIFKIPAYFWLLLGFNIGAFGLFIASGLLWLIGWVISALR